MKRLKYLIYVLAVGTLLVACGKKDITIDINEFSSNLVKDITFQDELAQVDESMLPMLYEINEGTQAVVYVGSGATAEEVAVFEASDKTAAKEMYELAKQHIEDQKESFEGYIPEELNKLENAIVRQEGKYVIVCVTEDAAAAKKVIDSYLK